MHKNEKNVRSGKEHWNFSVPYTHPPKGTRKLPFTFQFTQTEHVSERENFLVYLRGC